MSRTRSLFSSLYLPYLLLIIASVFVVSWYGIHSFQTLSLKQLASRLESQAYLVRQALPDDVSIGNLAAVDSVCVRMGRIAGIRVTVILPTGEVSGESDADPGTMNDHRSRPEVRAALAGKAGVSSRFSHTLNAQMHYVAVPLKKEGKVIAVVRTAIAATEIDEAMDRMYFRVGGAGLLIALTAAFVSFYIARRHRRMLQEMQRGAERFAAGELGSRLPESTVEEFAALDRTMNKMAAQLDKRIRAITQQREEQEAVLAGMVEGVVAVDRQERIIIANQAAARMFDFSTEKVKGRFVQEIVRNGDVQRFVKQALQQKDEQLNALIMLDEGSKVLQACASVIHDPQHGPRGSVIVFNDITRMRKLELTRREFVANVSHELKTPITSIKGYIETLRDEAPMSDEDREKFLGIIARQADQLTATIDDLLALGRIEREADSMKLRKEQCSLYDVLQEAKMLCQKHAEEKGQTIELAVPEEIIVAVNSRLMEQAVMNLIDNAVKYGNQGGHIDIRAAQEGDEVVIEVKDDGPGISQEHLPRLFERFYRTDRGRSRSVGGTGLGLAIVKHIAQAHKGSASVESEVGKGSVFTIRFPAEG
ncbi:PAS domain-containing protein [bacterium]|nr:PAS domain-containing protein [bacterium]